MANSHSQESGGACRYTQVMGSFDREGGLWGLLGALLAAVVSSLCCLGPLVYLVFGVSAAGFSGLQRLGWLQWPMMAVSLALLVAGFWRLYLSPKPYCSMYMSRRTMCVLFWLAVPLVLVLVVLFYPFFLPYVLEWLA